MDETDEGQPRPPGIAGTKVTVRVARAVRRRALEGTPPDLHGYVTALPDDGAANTAVQDVLAEAPDVAKSRHQLIAAAT